MDSVHPRVTHWCSDAGDRWYLETETQFRHRTSDDESIQSYARACPVAGADHTQYRLREVQLTSGAKLIAGIHFRGMAIDHPFVGVFAQSRWLVGREMSSAHRELLSEFAVFSPQASRWWVREADAWLQIQHARPDQHLVMGSIDELRATRAPSLPTGWGVRKLQYCQSVAEAFTRMYRDFHRAVPALAEAVPVGELKSLEECAAATGLLGLFAGEELAGLIALRPSSAYGVDAWLVQDVVLDRQHCGKGLAVPFQHAALHELDTAQAPLIAGTIHARNQPSLHTALRVGRRIVGTWLFLDA